MNTETTAPTETTTETPLPTGNLLTPVNRTILPGHHPATVIDIYTAQSKNGHDHVVLDCDLGHARIQYLMWTNSARAKANTKKQLKHVFDIDVKKDFPKAIGAPCSLNMKEVVWEGRPKVEATYVNPPRSIRTEGDDFDSDGDVEVNF